MMFSKMPRIETLRKYYPDCKLSDDDLLRISEWVKEHEGKNHISPDNRILNAIIVWEQRRN